MISKSLKMISKSLKMISKSLKKISKSLKMISKSLKMISKSLKLIYKKKKNILRVKSLQFYKKCLILVYHAGSTIPMVMRTLIDYIPTFIGSLPMPNGRLFTCNVFFVDPQNCGSSIHTFTTSIPIFVSENHNLSGLHNILSPIFLL